MKRTTSTAKRSALVADGNEVKARLEAERIDTKSPVHIDWLRFTCLLRNSPAPSVDLLFPTHQSTGCWDADYRLAELNRILRELPNEEFSAAAQARDLAGEVAAALGSEFSVSAEVKKGQDFYKFRWSIERGGAECGWVGFLASSTSPRQAAQAKTLHVNLYGHACTFAERGWNDRLADLCEDRDADLTRVDLALDFFDGLAGGLDQIVADYKAGVLDVGGRRLSCACVGDWINGRERSFYVGSKEAGKQTNVYEKGDQLYGVEANSAWLRAELRYGNKLRVLPVEMLRRPADFFGGASDWHASLLVKADAIVQAEPVKCTGRLASETIEAEVARNVRWAFNSAAPTMAAAFQFLGEEFLQLVSGTKLPKRLAKFTRADLSAHFAKAFHRVEGASPAFA